MQPFHGMIRATLKTTSLVGSYPSSDLVLIGELVLHGEFYRNSEYLFFKEIILTRQCEHIAHSERIAWYDQKKGQLHLTRWKWFFSILLL